MALVKKREEGEQFMLSSLFAFVCKYVSYDKGMFVGRVLIVGLALRILVYFFRIGSQVRLTPSFLKIFWSTSLSMTVQ